MSLVFSANDQYIKLRKFLNIINSTPIDVDHEKILLSLITGNVTIKIDFASL